MRFHGHTSVEAELLDAIGPRLEKAHVQVVRADIHTNTHVVDVTLQLPAWADRDLRHEALQTIAELERQLDHAVTTNPTFVWGDPELVE